MNPAIETMLNRYQLVTADDYRQAIREIIQELALMGLSRGDFFSKAAFYGGTCLRIFHQLPRFSEDLDFSLLSPDPNFRLNNWLPYLENELKAWGFEFRAERIEKVRPSAIESAFIRGDTQTNLLHIGIPPGLPGFQAGQQLKIKLEVDVNPPSSFQTQILTRLLPIPWTARLYDLPSLFAGKIHALLFRKWISRVKGRDYYDFQWYLSRSVRVNLTHLRERMVQSGDWPAELDLRSEQLVSLLTLHFKKVDVGEAKKEVSPFLRDQREIELWSPDYFCKITEEFLKVQP